MATLQDLKSAIKNKIIARTKASMGFSDVVSIAQEMTADEKAEFARKIIAGEPACQILTDRLNKQINDTAQIITDALIDNDLTTMAELKAALGIQ